ncbi:hypothetical protein AK812_SmicGene36121 [Symbiodinium microadriaticum]|uniref:Uncharacterized protein n=1 Tax=Symbiodinium microadriaticum TaxID=2951 RepID=A0A1Q9CJQ4_SYMMI|nr:hypothetical protein AK812_SmicGene36121 [Symbiodinium microadriaticum]
MFEDSHLQPSALDRGCHGWPPMATAKKVAVAAWAHGGQPRSKAYADTRPADFGSFKEIPGREDLLRLICGRLMTSDGQDIQDDYTIPIEKKLWGKPLDSILRSTYCKARGVSMEPDEAEVRLKFMLPEAGAGLGWLDTSLSVRQLQLKDSDIVEVLVIDRAAPLPTEASANLTRAEALQLLAAGRPRSVTDAWLAKVWSVLSRYAEDDHLVGPGLEHLAEAVEKDASLCTKVFDTKGNSCDVVRLLSRLLGASQLKCQSIVKIEGAEDATLRTRLGRSGKAVALKLQRRGDAVSGTQLTRFLDLVGGAKPKAPEQKEGVMVVAPAGGYQAAQDFAARAAERWQEESTAASVRLERAIHQDEPMEIEKALHNLISKMRRKDMNWRSVEEAGVGQLLRQLTSFEGDGEIPKLARKAVLEAVVREVTAALQLVPAPVPAPAAGGAPPAWAAPMVANIATLTANVATLTASNANQRRCSRNAAAIRRDVDGAGPQPVEMLCKELPGFGVLPAGALSLPVLAAHPPHPGPAVFPPPALHQPATTRISLTGQQISFLQCWYNDTFGIVAGDAVRAQRGAQLECDKLLNFLAGR